jgi:hypothetical protein
MVVRMGNVEFDELMERLITQGVNRQTGRTTQMLKAVAHAAESGEQIIVICHNEHAVYSLNRRFHRTHGHDVLNVRFVRPGASGLGNYQDETKIFVDHCVVEQELMGAYRRIRNLETELARQQTPPEPYITNAEPWKLG